VPAVISPDNIWGRAFRTPAVAAEEGKIDDSEGSMRAMYDWYLPPKPEEIERVWSTGILTVDTNVLLDLYRYHEQTREQLLISIEAFKGRVWLAHQASEEFIRNRTTVIAGAAKTFKDAAKTVDVLRSAAQTASDTLAGYRLVPRPLIEAVKSATTKAIEEAIASLTQAEGAYPNYFRDDPILERLLSLFDGAVGQPPTPDELDALHKEGEIRKVSQIPPGYLDKDKDGSRPYGDFILWRQMLLHAKERQLPIVFVTSERKPDWWEEHSGKRIGPRRELLLEASRVAAQRVLIYQTEQFVQVAATRQGRPVEDSIVKEIQEIGQRRELDPAQDAAGAPTGAIDALELKWDTAHARCIVSDGRFVVQRGSTARVTEVPSLNEGSRLLRADLLKRGVLSESDNKQVYLFTEDYSFDTPSAAAAVVSGTGLNGRRHWMVEGTKISYGQWMDGQQRDDQAASEE
jgi:hypothetical protein